MYTTADISAILAARGQVAATVSIEAAKYGVSPYTAVADSIVESGLNPGAIGDAGASYGLFQLNTRGGEGIDPATGRPYPLAQLQDPAFNADVALSRFGGLASQYGDPGALAAAAERPAAPGTYAMLVDSVVAQLHQVGWVPPTAEASATGTTVSGADVAGFSFPAPTWTSFSNPFAQALGNLPNIPGETGQGLGAIGAGIAALPAEIGHGVADAGTAVVGNIGSFVFNNIVAVAVATAVTVVLFA